MKKIKVLHITPHGGGGIGAALAGITPRDDRFEHDILLLEKPEKPEALNRLTANGCGIYNWEADLDTAGLLQKADIVQINWWHHPAMCRFLQNFPSTDIRSCLWVHVSGCTYPYVRKKLLEKFDMVFFCCAKTYENGEVSALSPDFLKNNTAVIYGMGEVSPYFSVQRKKHDTFTVGYLGTLSLSKIHPEFVAFCAAAELDNAVFLVAGDDRNKEVFYPDIMKYNMRHRIKFCGFLRGGEIDNFFSSCDIFGYPLNPLHFGATENVLLEAMASGLPAVVLNQGVEKFIVEDGKTGMVVSTKKEYGDTVRFLRDNPDVRIAMGKYARLSVSERFNTRKNRELLYEKYDELMEQKKHPVNFSDLWGNTPSDMFLFAVENEKEMFEQNNIRCIPHIFREESKSSVFHFERYFPQDDRLRHWANQLRAAEEETV